MKIWKKDYGNVQDYLLRKRWEGEEFVAFPDNSLPVNKDELFTFSRVYDVKEFCYEMSTDVDRYDYLAVRSAYRVMDEARNDNNLMIEKNGIIDLALMVSLRYTQFEIFNNNLKLKVMNQKNFEFLRDQVKYAGFGEGLENDLKVNIQDGKPEFSLEHQTKFGEQSLLTTLQFKQSNKSDMYFFNSYKVMMMREGDFNLNTQTFYINKGKNITLKEAFNLMEGRSVNKDITNKEGIVNNKWIQLDFKQSENNGNHKLKYYHSNYGYDLESTLSKYPIKELNKEDFKSNLIDSIKKGNLQSVTFMIDGNEQKRYIEANPQFKTINIYDGNMQRIDNRPSKKEKQSEGESQSAKQDSKKEKRTALEDDEPEKPKASRKKRRKQSVS